MTIDLTHLPISPDEWCAFIDQALSLGDKCEVDYLEVKGTLSFAPSERKASAALVAKAILGMANRMPVTAAIHLGGYGVVLVGITDGVVTGAEDVDAAELRNALDPYLGTDGPGWRTVYIQHPAGLVLSVVVNPPKWGDRQQTFRKEFGKYRDGTVFVRVPGQSRPATSSDVAALEDRRERSSNKGAQVVVTYSSTVDRVNVDSVCELIQEAIDKTRARLLFDVDRVQNALVGSRATSKLLLEVSRLGDNRSEREFRTEVAKWHTEASNEVQYSTIELFRHLLARGRFTVANTSPADTYLEGVQVEVEFETGVVPLAASQGNYHDDGLAGFDLAQLLPTVPHRWGTATSARIILGDIDPPVRARRPVQPAFTIDEAGEGTRVSWEVGDLRPRSNLPGGELFAVVTEAEVEGFDLKWRVTARGLDHVFEGQMRVPVETGTGNPIVLRSLVED